MATTPGARSRLWVGASALVLAGPCSAGDWEFEPLLRVAETWTDNVHLAPPGRERWDLITEVSPQFLLQGRGARVKGRVDYRLQTFTYLRASESNRIDHLFSADGRAELLTNFFFVDARAERSQLAASLSASSEVDPALDSGSRATTQTFAVSPFARRTLGSTLTWEVRYLRDHVESDSGVLSQSDGDTFLASVKSGPAFNRFGWALEAADERVDYGAGRRTGRKMAGGELNVELMPSFAALAAAGYEEYDYPFVGEPPRGRYWSAGFKWEPTRLTRLLARGGERFFGRTWLAEASHQSRRLRWTARYRQDISSTRAQLLLPPVTATAAYLDPLAAPLMPDPIARARAIEEFIASRGLPNTVFSAVNVLSSQPFLERRLDAALTLRTARTTAIVALFRSDRDASRTRSDPAGFLATGEGGESPNVRQKGGNAIVSWRAAPRTEGELDVGAAQAENRDTARRAITRYARLGLRHALTRRAVASLDYRHLRGTNEADDRYRENAIVAAATLRF